MGRLIIRYSRCLLYLQSEMNKKSSFISYALLKSGLAVARLIPNGALSGLLYIGLKASGYRSQVININLKASFPYKEEHEISQLRKLFYQNLAEVTVSQIKGAKGGTYKYDNTKVISELANKHGAVLLLGSHYGCWEAAGKHITTLLPDLKQYVVYKKIRNTYVDEYLKGKRSDTVAIPIEMKLLQRVVLENLKANIPSAYYLIADQYPSSPNNGVEVDFLGQKTLFVNGPEKLVDKLGLGAVYMDTVINEGEVNINLVPFQPQKSTMAQYAQLLEQQIKKAPQHWLWSHKRWKNLKIY